MHEAMKKAFKSGRAGFAAGLCQVVAFMWLRTAMNYQYKNGGTFREAVATLWAEGGIPRLYRGVFPWAILQAPLARFGDTATNTGVLVVMSSCFPRVPLGVSTALGSCAGACWRILLTPLDTFKTTLQTDGTRGWAILRDKVSNGGVMVLWYGWEANYMAAVVGSYPWFVTVNLLSGSIPLADGVWWSLARNAFIGATAATVSDLLSNSFRVVKTKKQTSEDAAVGYIQAARAVIAQDGPRGLFLRGLDTRIFTNILQGTFFTMLWKGLSKGA